MDGGLRSFEQQILKQLPRELLFVTLFPEI